MRKRKLAFGLLALILVAYVYWRHRQDLGAALESTESAPRVENATAHVDEQVVSEGPARPVPLDIFIIMTNLKKRTTLASNFERLFRSLDQFSSKDINLHAICDKDAEEYLISFSNSTRSMDLKVAFKFLFYNAEVASEKIKDIISAMKPHFSSASGTYYSEDLFFLSLGLHLISPLQKVILVDIDTEFRADPANLFQFFQLFTEEQIFGLGPELSPVYKHVLFKFLHNLKNNPTNIGEPDIEEGFSGFNSGLVLLDLEKMRLSGEYETLVTSQSVASVAQHFHFKGHLGDQDFFTLLGIQQPHLIFKLPCSWNRQLCQWWREHGYADIFDRFFACEGKVKLYHGNCNSKIPER